MVLKAPQKKLVFGPNLKKKLLKNRLSVLLPENLRTCFEPSV
jgi:hypothetical protein